jgi:hypothetical protein
MSLIFTIFALVFLTELISWIGKSVLLEFVRSLPHTSYAMFLQGFLPSRHGISTAESS